MSAADTSTISAILSDLLAKIVDCKNYLNSKSWYFAGKSTYYILHGKNNNKSVFYNDTLQVNCKYDQIDEDKVTQEMFYDPRYKLEFVQQYNTNYNHYCIGWDTKKQDYYLVDLDTDYKYIGYSINGNNQTSDTTHRYAAQVYAAAKAMEKLSFLKTNGLSEDVTTQWYNDVEIKKTVDECVLKLKTGKFGLDSVSDTFVRYQANIDEMDLWYDTANDINNFNNMLNEYKESIDKLYEIASKAASSGGTIINCINNANNNNISGNKYSYVQISQVMVCMASDTDIDASTNDDINEYFDYIVETLSKKASKERSIKIIVISVIISLVILGLFVAYAIGINVYKNNKIKKLRSVSDGKITIVSNKDAVKNSDKSNIKIIRISNGKVISK